MTTEHTPCHLADLKALMEADRILDNAASTAAEIRVAQKTKREIYASIAPPPVPMCQCSGWPDPASTHLQLAWDDTPERRASRDRRKEERRAEIDTDAD